MEGLSKVIGLGGGSYRGFKQMRNEMRKPPNSRKQGQRREVSDRE